TRKTRDSRNMINIFRSHLKNGQLICTRESDPVRGPDGKTHGNKCAMCKERLNLIFSFFSPFKCYEFISNQPIMFSGFKD
uniref:Kazal-like domain-containing protein n=1 Tax=Urocitellus parryii TaxID=9999 RepID=A0A8D2HQ78_UROPR